MKRLLTENIGMKLLSLALAGLLWVAIVGEQELSSSVSVPVEYKNFPKSLEASSEMVSRVNLLVHAAPEKLEAGNLAGAALVVDLSEVQRPGERTFNLDRQSLRLPQGVTLERVIPSQIRLRFEQRTARDVPVIIRYANTPMPGYRIAKQEVSPEVLRVVGPQSRVEELQSAETDPIDLSGVLNEAELRVNTFVADGQVRIEGPSVVRVRVIMERIAQPALEQYMGEQGMGKQLFGTDGMRGVAGEYPLDAPTVYAFGRALGEWAREHSAEPRVAIGMDTRESGEQLSRWLMAGLKAAGVTPDHHGVITTPCVAWLTKHGPFVAGVMISASHNPYQDNGLKVFAHSGYKLPDAVEQELEDRIFALAGPAPEPVNWRWFGMRDRAYREHLASVFPLPLAGRKLVMDCANGAAFSSAPLLLRELGAEVIVLSGEPDGRNINAGCGALHPDHLRRAVVEHGAWCGVAFDGDADRAMFVSATGKVIDGDHVLFILGRDLKRRGRLPKAEVVATVMSNLGLEVALRRCGIALVRTAVGDKYVLEEMIRREAVIGGEQSGHMIFHEFATTGDGVLTLLLLLDVMLRDNAGLDALTEEFTVFPQRLINVRFAVKRPLEEQAAVQEAIRDCEREFGDAGRVLVRFSGTEPLARVMVEGPSAERVEHHAQAIAARIAAALV